MLYHAHCLTIDAIVIDILDDMRYCTSISPNYLWPSIVLVLVMNPS